MIPEPLVQHAQKQATARCSTGASGTVFFEQYKPVKRDLRWQLSQWNTLPPAVRARAPLRQRRCAAQFAFLWTLSAFDVPGLRHTHCGAASRARHGYKPMGSQRMPWNGLRALGCHSVCIYAVYQAGSPHSRCVKAAGKGKNGPLHVFFKSSLRAL